MSRLGAFAASIVSLFVDDGSLAIAVGLILVVTAFLASTPWFRGPVSMAFLVAAVVAVLIENVLRTARSARKGV